MEIDNPFSPNPFKFPKGVALEEKVCFSNKPLHYLKNAYIPFTGVFGQVTSQILFALHYYSGGQILNAKDRSATHSPTSPGKEITLDSLDSYKVG